MADDLHAKIAQLEAENAALRQREAVLTAENLTLRRSETAHINDVADCGRALAQATAQQTATAEVLRVIASSPMDVQVVLESILETAARLCDSPGGILMQVRQT